MIQIVQYVCVDCGFMQLLINTKPVYNYPAVKYCNGCGKALKVLKAEEQGLSQDWNHLKKMFNTDDLIKEHHHDMVDRSRQYED